MPPLLAPAAQPGTSRWPSPSYLQGPGRGWKGTSPSSGQGLLPDGRLCGQKAGEGPTERRPVRLPPTHPQPRGKPTLCKGALTSASPPLAGWEAGLQERWGAQSRAPGNPVLVYKQRPSGGSGSCSGLPRTQFPTPKFTGLHAVGRDFKAPKASLLEAPSSLSLCPQAHRTGLEARDRGGYKAGGEGRGR